MKPLNAQERSNQFFIFLGFFVVTMALVIGVVYFDFDSSNRQNKIVKEQNARLREQINYNDKYLANIDFFIADLNGIRSLSGNPMKLRQDETQRKVVEAFASVANDSTLKINKLYSLQKYILDIFSYIQELKDKNIELTTKLAEANEKFNKHLEDDQRLLKNTGAGK